MRFIANAAASAFLLAAACGTAFAQTNEPVQTPRPIKGIVGIGITFGGDRLFTGEIVNNTGSETARVNAGGGVPLYGGIEYRVSDQFALQATVGHHADRVKADNGEIRFTRMPVDVLGLFSVSPEVRLGGGIQHVSAPKIRSSGVVAGRNTDYEPSTALVVEGEYLFGSSIGVKGRLVGHKFKVKNSNGPSVNGNHFGVLMSFYF
jgi:hypothetical protein